MRLAALLLPLAALVTACDVGTTTECTVTDNGGRACVPSTAPQNTPITLRVRPNGCANACSGTVGFRCDVTVEGQRVKLAVQQEICLEQQNQPMPFGNQVQCAEACRIADPVDCAVPALAAGDYSVETVDDTTSLTLLVRATGDTQCAAPAM